MARAPPSGIDVVDLTTGQTVFSSNPYTGRLPVSVEKLYTTSTALLRFGANARLRTSILGAGSVDQQGGWQGPLYLKGGGDPTFGARGFDHDACGGGVRSDNFFAELLLKGIGAAFGGSGTTAAGAAVVRAQMASSFGIHPQLEDGCSAARGLRVGAAARPGG